MPQVELEIEKEVTLDTPAKVVLYNDEVNSFEHVIDSLVSVCKHSRMQAEQCAMIVHNKGRYSVKEGPYETMLLMADALTLRRLSATVEVS